MTTGLEQAAIRSFTNAVVAAPGGLETLAAEDRERVAKAKDTQLEKAMELLKAKLAAAE